MPPQAELPEGETSAPSQLILIQFLGEGFQMTSIILGALGEQMLTRKFLSNSKSCMFKNTTSTVLPAMETTSRMNEMEEGKLEPIF